MLTRAKCSGQTDEALVAMARGGNRIAADELVRRHRAFTLARARGFVRNEAAAEDVAQIGWLKVFEQLSRFDGRSSFRTWVGTIVSRTAIDWLRKKRPVCCDEIVQKAEDVCLSPTTPHDRLASQQQIERSFQSMSKAQREVMSLVAQGYTQDEIACRLQIPRGTVMSRRFLARVRIRQQTI